jgi:hypothetical protein
VVELERLEEVLLRRTDAERTDSMRLSGVDAGDKTLIASVGRSVNTSSTSSAFKTPIPPDEDIDHLFEQ